jgi:hypothetical protein
LNSAEGMYREIPHREKWNITTEEKREDITQNDYKVL